MRYIIFALCVACGPYFLVKCSVDSNKAERAAVTNKVTGERSAGKIIAAQRLPTGWSEPEKMQMQTERFTVVFYGTDLIAVGEEATIYDYADGSRAIQWPSSKRKHYLVD